MAETATQQHEADWEARRRRRVPSWAEKRYSRALGGKSRGAAIAAMCLECCGYDRREVAACPATACPLHPYRPGRPRAK